MAVVTIAQGSMSAKIQTIGGSLIGLSDAGFELIEPNTAKDLYPGSILAPWPNRIKDGKYQFDGLKYQLPINEISRSNSLHGLVAHVDWQINEQAQNKLKLKYTLDLPNIYPGKLLLTVYYEINNNCLSVKISSKNIGSQSAPYGVSIHTYFIAGKIVKNNQLFLKVPADKYLDVDSLRLLPISLKPIENTEFDFQKLRQIGSTFIDHAFRHKENLPREVELQDHLGRGVMLEFDQSSKWIQIHTADRNGAEQSRNTVAIEPMSCPPDAFNSDVDVINLKPGDSHDFQIWIKQKT
ncbi:unannotated protein [freshwater metagenome]|jgi:aldose 1-epimerase|uniref:Unannotated protein n=1 Tax=freshwater metagenome TaxID=449393 RepID=A0A6J7QA35_9ZZZZ|nr:galactose mutarotase [Actinomycetota bacterium]MSW08159.1 galactose mutarotase [Actinomycetota bacterium]MSY77749.1 galactose mutarotase [Actinomycetota bacterium]MSZ15630.1 galactose mutarotase [Actinomycetota bacterium]MSZ32382.1 galactose mutarotase [Actinomycetota bacterium]